MAGKASGSSRSYRTVGRYRVYSELAVGGMATVHLGCLLGSAGFSKLVAIKCLHEEFALEKDFVSMFLDEARLASSIHHPNVVASLDVVAEQGELLVVMEYVHGETLGVLLRTSRQTGEAPSLPVVTRILCDALEGIHAAHVASLAGRRLNIVHRDVSPQNLMVGADGNTRVLDFGIAQAALRSQSTAAGTIKGKLAYMSPEQVQGLPVDARTDIFAAGVVLWEALTGKRLFFAPDSREVVNLLLTSPIPAPSVFAPGLTRELDRVVLKALARDAAERFQTAHDFAEGLRNAAEEGSRRDVAAWVGRVAKEGLAQRLEQLQALEASAIHTQAAVKLPVVLPGSSPRAAFAPGAETSQTRATSTRSILPTPSATRARWRERAPWWAALGGILSSIAAWVYLANAPPEPRGRVAAARASASANQIAAARPSASASPTIAAAPSASASPVAVAPAPASASPITGVPSAQSSALAAAAMATESLPLARSAVVPPRVAHVKAVASNGPAPAVAHSHGNQCSPPYRLDSSGVRRIKPECL